MPAQASIVYPYAQTAYERLRQPRSRRNATVDMVWPHIPSRSYQINRTSPPQRTPDAGRIPVARREQPVPLSSQLAKPTAIKPRLAAPSMVDVWPANGQLPVIKAQPLAKPAAAKQQPTRVLKREMVQAPNGAVSKKPKRSQWMVQTAMVTMAVLIFLVGLGVTWQTIKTNHAATQQVATLAKHTTTTAATTTDNSQPAPATVPSTTRPSARAISQYIVAPDLPRYLKIPKIGVNARVLQVGVTSTGALGTPSNVYDTAWYTGSAKPGQPGATLIDGHVSSWTTQGVFYNLKKLVAGDGVQIVRGDGTVLNYTVVKTQLYSSTDVDMQAAMEPVTAGQSGLNLITCTGQVIKGTSEFNQRVIVFATQS